MASTRLLRCLAMVCILSIALSGLGLWGQEPASGSAMHARVQALYSFSPSKVTDEIRTSKSKDMDVFWEEVKNHQDTELPLLRNELRDATNPPFFFADATGLLMSLSHTPEDESLAVTALARVDLADFQPSQYLFEVHDLAVDGANVTPAALHLLDDQKFVVYLPKHGAYKLDQAACLQVALMPLPASLWLPVVMDRMRVEHDETAMKSLLLLMFYAQTNESDRAIRLVASGTDQAAPVRAFANDILKHESALGIGKNPSPSTETKLREQRRTRMAAVSDEAMDDMYELTNKIARARTVVR